ncbi:MAG: cellulase family glycosylhydrolase [Chitinispirillaceae bacterium]|nr:cellulase family glycosylhydrolase [Chitinispirillaceae bacterium]
MSRRISPICRISFPVILILTFTLPGGSLLRAQGVAQGPMRNMTAKQLVYEMKIGWNLGNTLDATTGGETGWGNPMTTQAMMDAVKAMGFKTVRIPVTWQGHFGGAPNYTIDQAWLNRVEEIANYVLRDSMYAIINSHHDEWVTLTASSQTAVSDRLARLWTQIAARFRNYSDYLVFETLNEPRQSVNEWTGGTPTARSILNTYHQAAVDAIRATGGNNASRLIMCCTHAATPSDDAIAGLTIPDNNDPRIVVSIHTYYPNGLSFGGVTTWGTASDKASIIQELDREQRAVASKGGGTAVIGEWGTIDQNNLSVRVAHAEFYAQEARKRGMLPIWWDNGGSDFRLLNRRAIPPSWYWPTIAQALVRGANNGVVSIDRPSPSLPGPAITGVTVKAGIVTYTVASPSFVSLRLLSTQGRTVSTLVASVKSAGNHSIALPAKNLSSGPYIISLQTDSRREIKKIILSRR